MSAGTGTRRPFVAGNWKMNKTAAEAEEFTSALLGLIGPDPAPEVVLCPPFTALAAVAEAASGSPVWVAAQNVSEHESGAHTGEISAAMILAAGAAGTIIGHSERRAMGETDAIVAQRVRRAIDAGLRVILCCGESLDQREAGETDAWLTGQLRVALAGVQPGEIGSLVIAYEPIWAIGTGRTATPDQAQDACAHVRRVASERVDGAALQVLYGGSVTPDTAAELMACPDVDGSLVGGASLDPAKFAAIVAASG